MHTISLELSPRLAERLKLCIHEAGIEERDLLMKAVLDFVETTEARLTRSQSAPIIQPGTLSPMYPQPPYTIGDPPPGYPATSVRNGFRYAGDPLAGQPITHCVTTPSD